MLDILKVILLGIVEGITEWLPISSTGHMILVEEFVKLGLSEAFKEMFFVVVQLGAILAVIILYWSKLVPVRLGHKIELDTETMSMWYKIVIASVPAGVVGVFLEDELNRLFYNYQTVSVMLIVFGILFIWIENMNRNKESKMCAIADITYMTALCIGIFQLIAAVFPGTSRSGATIVGALLLGVSRTAAAEFTFFLAIPAMFGASAIKLFKFGFHFTGTELICLGTGMLVALIVSILSIKFLVGYIQKNDFKIFGWYRIVLGCLVLGYFFIF